MNKHSPSPWVASCEITEVDGVTEPLFAATVNCTFPKANWPGPICAIQSCDFLEFGRTREQAAYDTALIESAPDLLSTLQAIVAMGFTIPGDQVSSRNLYAMAVKAITAATTPKGVTHENL